MSEKEKLQLEINAKPATYPHVLEHRHPRTCSECDGKGSHETPIWKEFWSQPPEVCRQLFNNIAELRLWFKERDALTPINPRRPDILIFPVSETHCPQCRGTGLYPAK